MKLENNTNRITKRQIEILELMAKGYKEEDIAKELRISHVTLRRHKSLLYPRLGVNNSVSAVVTAIDLGLIKWELATKNRIERTIIFEPEYLQSGITILNYFSTILQQKKPEYNSIVRIEQEGLKVRLLIIPEKGEEIEVIEKTLEEYGLVISGIMKVTEFLSDNLQILELENKLEISKLELRFAQRQIEIERQNHDGRIKQIENEVSWLRGQIGTTLSNATQISIETKSHFNEELKQYFNTNDKLLLKSLEIIEKFLEVKETNTNEKEIIDALNNVKKKNPSILNHLMEFTQKTVSSASGKLLYDLINSLI